MSRRIVTEANALSWGGRRIRTAEASSDAAQTVTAKQGEQAPKAPDGMVYVRTNRTFSSNPPLAEYKLVRQQNIGARVAGAWNSLLADHLRR